MYKIDFNKPIHVHFIGIGGISMSGLAEILLEEGFTISGSDSKESPLTRKLEAEGAHIFYGQKAENITDGHRMCRIYSGNQPQQSRADRSGSKKNPHAHPGRTAGTAYEKL